MRLSVTLNAIFLTSNVQAFVWMCCKNFHPAKQTLLRLRNAQFKASFVLDLEASANATAFIECTRTV